MATGIFFPSVVAMQPGGCHGAGVSLHGPHHQDDDDRTQDQEAPQPMVQSDDDEEEDDGVEQVQEPGHQQDHHHTEGHVGEQGTPTQIGAETTPQVTAMELGAAALTLGRRITLKPRRTLSLSPTPARTGDMSMGRNLRAARCLDFTDKDDDDGLNRADSDCEDDPVSDYKKKGDDADDDDAASTTSTEGELNPKARCMISRAGAGARTVHSNTFPRRSNGGPVSGQKRPLEDCLVAACQEIQYLDISYQKVSTVTVYTPQVQLSPIPRKKIAYHPVLHSHIHYCDVTYIAPGEKEPITTPVRRKPPQRSHSFAAIGERGLREKLGTITEPLFRSQWASGISREHQYGPSHSIRAAVAVSAEYSR